MTSEMQEAIIRYEAELECACDVEDFEAGWQAALHSVEADKPKPVGHFYNRPSDGRVGVEWCCDHLDDGAALYAEPVGVEAEKEPEWISCNERFPEAHDADCFGKVWMTCQDVDGKAQAPILISWDVINRTEGYWKPTGLRRPAPPEHKPE